VTSIQRFASVESARLPEKPLHLAIGMFDGVHLGHRAVIEAAVRSARREDGVPAVLTFRPHPSAVLRPERPTPLILDSPAQAQVLGALGVQALITHPFTLEFSRIGAEAFVSWVKERLPLLSAVYVGENFRFGAGRGGNAAVLVAEGRRLGLSVLSVPRVSLDGGEINSTRIRNLLVAGEIARANALLGYAYFSRGSVVPGKRLGRRLGFPTLNLPWSPELRPRFGVYAVRVSGRKAGPLPGVANFGLRPTMEDAALPQLEVHVTAPCPYVAGDEITVEWLRFIRPEVKFPSPDALRDQIGRDIAAAAGP
jgi:riboflavin kinase/FMN adenylyltransferase